MTHILLLAEGYSDTFKKFEEEQHGRTFANGKAKLRVREVKLYTCSINEEGKSEFFKELKGLVHPTEGYIKSKTQNFKWKTLYRLVKYFSKLLGVKPLNLDNYELNPHLILPRAKGGQCYNAHFMLIGELPDIRDEYGKEVV